MPEVQKTSSWGDRERQAAPTGPVGPGPKVIHNGVHHRVVTGLIKDMPDTAEVLKIKYIVQCPEDGVVYGLFYSRGQAIAGCFQADAEWAEAERIIAEKAAREKATDEDDGTAFPSLQ